MRSHADIGDASACEELQLDVLRSQGAGHGDACEIEAFAALGLRVLFAASLSILSLQRGAGTGGKARHPCCVTCIGVEKLALGL